MAQKHKHENVVIATITLAAPFSPTDPQSFITASANIAAVVDGIKAVRVVSVERRIGKLPAVPGPNMPPIPAGMKR